MIKDLLSVVSIYTAIVGTYFGVRVLFHFLNKPYKKFYTISSTIVIPVYQENSEVFRRCLESCLSEGPDELIVVDDGSKELISYNIALAYAKKFPNLGVFRFEKNRGKRHALAFAFQRAKGEIIVAVDSDSVLEGNALEEILKPFQDLRIGAVAGQLSALNKSDNVLTKILNIRYIVAGALERAAYSFFRVVNCTSGPFSAYRRSLLLVNLNDFITQTHRGKTCTFGDDRHLTSLVLKSGYDVFFQKTAKARTTVPRTMKGFATQQLRWNRSFWRENWLVSHWMWKRSKYLAAGTIMDMALPFLYLSSLIWNLRSAVSFGLFLALPFLLTASLVAYARNFESLRLTTVRDFALAPIYAWVYLFVLLPISVYATFTTHKTGWGTR